MSAFAGKWKLAESTNFDEYMKAIGVDMMTRKMGGMAKPVQEITVTGDTFNIKTTTTFKSSDITFTLGQEFDETTADGRKVKSIVKAEGDTLVHEQSGDPPNTIIREIKDGNYVMTLKCKDVVCTRIYKPE